MEVQILGLFEVRPKKELFRKKVVQGMTQIFRRNQKRMLADCGNFFKSEA
jgi:hypothetical protein